MDQTWYVQWTDNWLLRGSLVTWKILKTTFLDRSFPREKREEKVRDLVIFSNEWRMSMTTLWSSLIYQVLFWSPILETKWVVLWRGCRRTYKRSANQPSYMTTWKFPALWFMQEGFRRHWLRKKKGEMLRGQGHLMKILQRIGLRYKTSLNLWSGFLINSHPNSKDIAVIGCLTLNSRR